MWSEGSTAWLVCFLIFLSVTKTNTLTSFQPFRQQQFTSGCYFFQSRDFIGRKKDPACNARGVKLIHCTAAVFQWVSEYKFQFDASNRLLCPDSYWWCTPSDLHSAASSRLVLKKVSKCGVVPCPITPPQLLWSTALWWKHLVFKRKADGPHQTVAEVLSPKR